MFALFAFLLFSPIRHDVVYRVSGDIVEGQAKDLEATIARAKRSRATGLVILINSDGGDAVEGIKMYEAIRTSGIPSRCEVHGDAASAAFLILQACNTRAATRASLFATHRPLAVIGPGVLTVEEMHSMNEAVKAIAYMFDGLIAHRLMLPLTVYIERVANGKVWYMSAPDALAAHAIDEVIGE